MKIFSLKSIFTAFIIITINFWPAIGSDDLKPFKIFEADGGSADFDDILDAAEDADVIFFGELHGNPICHWTEYRLLKALDEKFPGKISLGVEMFERDDQLKIDEYFSGVATTKNFENEAKLWDNYKTDYKRSLEYAKSKKIPYYGTNVPRRYAAFVARNGLAALDSLNSIQKGYISKLPIETDYELPGYKKMSPHGMPQSPDMKYLVEAQMIKDATMAQTIYENIRNGKFLHFNGTYHSDNHEGVVWYLKRLNPKLRILTISSTEQDSVDELSKDNKELADYILVIPSDMIRSF
ncbi:MAG: ChaN family lipoprotein [Chloroflexota bacterium]